jgi:hypothetical protein
MFLYSVINRITSILKVETDIIFSISTSPKGGASDTSDKLCRDLQI